MLQWLKDVFGGPTEQELLEGLASFEAIHGRAFFPGKDCPFSRYVRKHGVETREFVSTRHDN